MAPFTTPEVVLSGLKERFESLTVQGKLYLGSSVGNLHIYNLVESTSEDGSVSEKVELVEVKKGLVKRSIDQIGFIRDVNSLVVLSDMTVTLFPLPSFSPATPLLKAKAAFSFAIYSYVEQQPLSAEELQGSPGFQRSQPIPCRVTMLLVGCRRKAVIYSWRDGEPQEVKEAPLPHSARSIVFLDQDAACFAYSPTEFAMFSIPSMTAAEITTPLPVAGSATAMTSAFTGLTGYMTLGLGAKAKPNVVQISQSEILIGKDVEGVFIGPNGRPTRPATIEWPVPPEEISFIKPYIFSVLPAGSIQTQNTEPTPGSSSGAGSSTQVQTNPTALVQIRSSLSMQITQTIFFPFNASEYSPIQNATIRLLTPSNPSQSRLYLLTTPTDKTAAANDGSSVWSFKMRPWSEQIDELVLNGLYADALELLDIVDNALLSDKDQRRTRIRALNAVAQFRASKFDAAIDTFIELDFNPAKVVALYPESVAGRLSVPRERWIPLYGGPEPEEERAPSSDNASEEGKSSSHEKSATEIFDSIVTSTTGSIGGRLRKGGLGMLIPGGAKDDDTASITARKRPPTDDTSRSIETLVRYLSDRRPKLRAALEAVNITPESQSHFASPLSEASVDELFELPNAPLAALTPEQLLRFAQLVDTALYKSYLVIRPGLLGPLCRITNWCEVSEVEEDLRTRKKYAELRDLYHGKKMHSKALDLLKELSDDETDMEDKLGPTIHYLQKLGPEYLDQIFKYARWVFETDSEMAFQIFTSEDVELPKKAVADYLEGLDPKLCAKYLEYQLQERQEETPAYHDRLAELYLSMTLSSKKKNDEKNRKDSYSKLLAFINTNQHISVERIYGQVAPTDLHEARAILLGRLGRHDQALETYVYRLQDFMKAEEYCKRIYEPGSPTSGVFLNLLRIYLRPTVQSSTDFLPPALELISRHSRRMDTVEALQLLPPLVTTDDIRAFLIEALRAPVFDTRVIRNIGKARNDQLARRLMVLQTKRVKITDSRICPQCHKRLGNSVIAVHAPRGEVTHYQCREPFTRRLHELRGS
ncbi:hypothetical protein CVT24_004627 [Panaeolus cyanescens]|uniref:CNH domain-containing protein n=1 Tax=Panaeolus cyanescens TaxID=181874 RepID=A0A409YSJ2_9AGAR|nr:hypothetical protein CVT24_004627 [Panaeolus cyanescens]